MQINITDPGGPNTPGKVPAYLESLCKLVCMEIRKHMCACEREITTEDTVLSFPWLDGRSI